MNGAHSLQTGARRSSARRDRAAPTRPTRAPVEPTSEEALSMRRGIAPVLALLALLAVGLAPAAAQDASPAATPAAECAPPPLPPGTPTPMEASPVADMAGMEGTPGAIAQAEAGAATAEAAAASPEPAASPVPPAGTPADQATIDRVAAAYAGALACLNAGDVLGFAAYLTPEALQEDFGSANYYDIPAIVEEFGGTPPTRFVRVDQVLVLPDGRLYADATYVWGNQLNREGAFLVERDGHLLLDAGTQELPVAIPTDAQVATAEMVDFAFNLTQRSFEAGRPIAFEVINYGQYPHELVVFGLPEGVTLGQVLADESLFARLAYAGDTFAEPGQPGDPLVLVDLAPGTYLAVCFVDEPEGIPHIERGMIAEFTVDEGGPAATPAA
jgi:hypothetical protein